MAAFHDLWFLKMFHIFHTLHTLKFIVKYEGGKTPEDGKVISYLERNEKKALHVFPRSKHAFNNKNVEIKLNFLSSFHSRDYITSLDFSTPLQTIVYNSKLAPECFYTSHYTMKCFSILQFLTMVDCSSFWLINFLMSFM